MKTTIELESDFSYYCLNTKRKAKQVYKAVMWSEDKLACCSECGETPWAGSEFKDKHLPIKKFYG